MYNKAYKLELKPTEEQKIMIMKNIGCARFVYNYMLSERIKQYEKDKTQSSAYKDMGELVLLKKEIEWLQEIDSKCLQKACQHLDVAYKRFFKCGGFPRFKKKGIKDNYTTQYPVIRSKHYVHLPKIGSVQTKQALPINKKYKTATISRVADRYFISILCEVGIQPKPKTGKEIGIDLGITDLAILSDGTKYGNMRYYKQLENRLAIEQRKLSKMQKGSNNRAKQRIKVARVHYKISCQRKDYLNKVTTEIANRYDKIVVEDLRVQNMKKNKHLSKAISDVAWGELVRMLEYKCKWYGKEFVKVNPQNTSKTCSVCGYVNKNLKLSDRKWTCVCGAVHDRDINASKNILSKSPMGSRVEPADTGCNSNLEQENPSKAVA